MTFRNSVCLSVLIALSCASAASADFPMSRYDGSQTSYTPEKLLPPLALKWEYVSNKYDNNPAAPVVAGRSCYFASGDSVYGIDLDTGALKWKYPGDLPLSSNVKGTPAVWKDKLFFGGGDGKLYCLNADTGVFEWAYETRGAIKCPPTVVDDVIYLGADDNSIYAIDAASGESIWTWTGRDDISNGIAVGAGMVIIASLDGNIIGLTSNMGRPRWPFRLPSSALRTSPLILETIVIMAVDNYVYGLSARSGQTRWTVTLPAEVAATPAACGPDLYIPMRNKTLGAYSFTGRQLVQKWTRPVDLGALPTSSPVVAGDLVYVTCQRGVVVCLSALDGTLKWRYVCAPSQATMPGSDYTDAASSPTVANGSLLVLTDDGVLRCFATDAPDCETPKAYKATPANSIAMSGMPPIKVAATLFDQGSGIDFSTVTMTLDGESLAYEIDYPTSTVWYDTPYGDAGKPAKPLPNGIHTVVVSAKDYVGNQLSEQWYFVVDNSIPPPKRAKAAAEKTQSKPTPARRAPQRNVPSQPEAGEVGAPPPPPPMGPGGQGGTPLPSGYRLNEQGIPTPTGP